MTDLHPSDASLPLVVDLDGTLLRGDLLHESASALILSGRPGVVLRALGANRASLKSDLAASATIDVSCLPYRQDVVDWIKTERARGRKVVLATAATYELAERVARYLGIFDAVYASDSQTNLVGARKANLLENAFPDGFEYVGNHQDDREPWSSCRVAHVVGGQRIQRLAADTAPVVGKVFEVEGPGPARGLLQAMRPQQWAKNSLVALPLLTAQEFLSVPALMSAAIAIVCFSLTASGVYLLNDLTDLESDRHHKTKCARPVAAGHVPLLTAWIVCPTLIALSFSLATALLNTSAVGWLAAYLVATTVYTFWAKRIAVLDVVFLGGLYTLRIIVGAAAIDVPLSVWLLAFSLLFFFSLALTKRVSELSSTEDDRAKIRGRGYFPADVEMLVAYGAASSVGAVVIFALYVNDPITADLYRQPELLSATIPVLLAWLMRLWLYAHRGEIDEDPVLFAFRDRTSYMAALIILGVFAVAYVGVTS